MAFTEGAPAHGKVAHLLPQTYKRLISEWLEEDTPSLDYGGFVVGEDIAEARLLGKSKVRSVLLRFTISLASSMDGDVNRKEQGIMPKAACREICCGILMLV